MTTVRQIYDYIDSFAPYQTAESYDNVGLLIGDFEQRVDCCAVTLDITPAAIDFAQKQGAQLIISHHPIIFHPLKSVHSSTPVYQLIDRHMSAIAAHTNLDLASGGVNDMLCAAMGFQIVPYEEHEGMHEFIGRICSLEEPMSARQIAALAKDKLGCEAVRFCEGKNKITTLAVCSGHGASFAQGAKERGADGFLTAEIAHDELIDAHREGFSLIDAGHMETEYVMVHALSEMLQKQFPQLCVIEVPRTCLGIESLS